MFSVQIWAVTEHMYILKLFQVKENLSISLIDLSGDQNVVEIWIILTLLDHFYIMYCYWLTLSSHVIYIN